MGRTTTAAFAMVSLCALGFPGSATLASDTDYSSCYAFDPVMIQLDRRTPSEAEQPVEGQVSDENTARPALVRTTGTTEPASAAPSEMDEKAAKPATQKAAQTSSSGLTFKVLRAALAKAAQK